MLVELAVVKQRYGAVREVLDTGATITDVAVRYGVSRQSIHRWLRLYVSKGLAGPVPEDERRVLLPRLPVEEVLQSLVWS